MIRRRSSEKTEDGACLLKKYGNGETAGRSGKSAAAVFLLSARLFCLRHIMCSEKKFPAGERKKTHKTEEESGNEMQKKKTVRAAVQRDGKMRKNSGDDSDRCRCDYPQCVCASS